jgi:protein-ribulosamine 3-kinase
LSYCTLNGCFVLLGRYTQNMDSLFQHRIEQELSAYCNENVRVQRLHAVGGGCINNAVHLVTSSGSFFLKTNEATLYPGMFEAEAMGLKMLKEQGVIGVPGVIGSGVEGNQSFILLEYIGSGKKIPDYWQDFGRSLAALHQVTSNRFGLDHDNYIGSLPQQNSAERTWVEFYITKRLQPMVEMAANARKPSEDWIMRFDTLYKKLPGMLPEEPPSLLHGDLWNGNFMTAKDGRAWLIDPAVYFGNREMDLAMTRLFGGFEEGFYDAYHEAFPLLPGWRERIELYQLYPLLVHVNLFGGGYIGKVKDILNRV